MCVLTLLGSTFLSILFRFLTIVVHLGQKIVVVVSELSVLLDLAALSY